MASNDYRMSLFIGSGNEGRELRNSIREQVIGDARFKGSEAEFVRYCIRYTLEKDKTLRS